MWGEVCMSGIARLVVGAPGGGEVCRLCGVSTPDAVGLQETVALQRSYCPPTMTLADILAVLMERPMNETELLPSTVCKACARAAIDSLRFLRLCTESHRCWLKICVELYQCLENTNIADGKFKSLYMFPSSEEPKCLVDKQKTSCASAHRRARALIRNERNRIEAKSSIEASGRSTRPFYQCEECGKLVKNRYLYEKHVTIHSQNLQCKNCQKICPNLPKLNMHIARAHSKKKYHCLICNKKFGSEYLVTEHRKVMHHRANCPLCGKMYSSKSALRAHEQTHNNWTCEKCGKSYKYKQTLRTHICFKREMTQEGYECADCGKCYSAKTSLQTHIQLEHIGNPHTCHLCRKKFCNASRLRDHAAVHTGRKRHSCSFCEGRFMSRTTLTNHIRNVHTGEKPYECWECGASFVSSHRRTEHRRLCHGEPALTCHECSARFATHHQLRKHFHKHLEPTSKLYCQEFVMLNSTDTAACAVQTVNKIEV